MLINISTEEIFLCHFNSFSSITPYEKILGTPEIGGLTPIQALEIIRGCNGLNIVGCDLVEVCTVFELKRKITVKKGIIPEHSFRL